MEARAAEVRAPYASASGRGNQKQWPLGSLGCAKGRAFALY